MSALPPRIEDITGCIARMERLSKALPSSVAVGTTQDRLYRLVTSINEGTPWETFNRMTDLLFKEDQDCRDENGRFRYVRRGKYGMEKFVSYLKNVSWRHESMIEQYSLVKLQLDRINAELDVLTGKAITEPVAAETRKKPAKSKKSAENPKKKKQELTVSSLLEGKELSDDSSDGEFEPDSDRREASEEPEEPFDLDEDGVEVIPDENEPRKRKRVTGSSSAITIVDVEDDELDGQPETKRRKGPSSDSQAYFKKPVAILTRTKKRWLFACKLCKSTLTFPRTVDKPKTFEDEPKQPFLGNLATHLRTKHPTRTEPPSDLPQQPGDFRGVSTGSARAMEKYLELGKLNPQIVRNEKGFYRVFAAWILEDDLPFTTGETPGIARLFHYMESRYKLPSDTTVRNYLARIFSEMYDQVKKELRNVKSRIACSTDTWTTKSMMFSFAGTIACWVSEDWELIERVVDFHPIADKEHEGQYAAQGFAVAMSDMEVLDKISCCYPTRFLETDSCVHIIALTLDNASSNDTLIAALSRILKENFDIQFEPENSQIRCLNHVTNIVVQKILATLREDDDPDVNDHFDKSVPAHYSPEEDQDQLDLEKEEDPDGMDEDEDNDDEKLLDQLLAAQSGELSPVKKLRTICIKITSSPQRRFRFRDGARKIHKDERTPDKKSRISELMVVKDVTTRWNYTHAMVKRALILRKPIDRWVRSYTELWSLTLLADEWASLEKLCALLEPFTHVTFQMSKSNTPTLPWVIPMYEFMIRHLTSYIDDFSNPSDLRRAAEAGLAKLQHYYAKAQKCQFNIIATMLHPSLGYAYFQKLGEDRAQEALTIFEHAYERYSKRENVSKSAPCASVRRSSSFLDMVRMVDVTVPSDDAASTTTLTELQRFLKVTDNEEDQCLQWWKTHHLEFPVIAKMARDFLPIPATSTSVERLFSKSRHLCADLRSSLHAHSIMKALLSKMWIKSGLFKYNGE